MMDGPFETLMHDPLRPSGTFQMETTLSFVRYGTTDPVADAARGLMWSQEHDVSWRCEGARDRWGTGQNWRWMGV